MISATVDSMQSTMARSDLHKTSSRSRLLLTRKDLPPIVLPAYSITFRGKPSVALSSNSELTAVLK